MPETVVQRFYRFHASVYDATRWMFLRGRRAATAMLELQPHHQVLEVGCGTGLNFRLILPHLDPNRGRLVGMDFSKDMLVRARQRVKQAGWSNVELVESDAAEIQWPDRFDAILYSYSLSMIPDWSRSLRSASDHLVNGGRLVVLDFGTFHGWGPLGALARGWLKWNHVETRRSYGVEMQNLLDDVRLQERLGGYYFIAVGKKDT